VHKLAEPKETQSQYWQRLMIAAQTAEPRAYAEFLREVSSFIRAIARRYHTDADSIEEVVQETLITVHRIRHTYEPGRAVEPWVAAIAKARAIDAFRARSRRQKMETPVAAETLANMPDAAPSSESTLAANSTIAEALAALPPAQRAAVRLLKIEELSLREASEASGQSIQALKSSLHRAMQSLRSMLTGGRDA
jgi:RNA polymerase sigma-70 factor (ECF subfamily)